jgi:hypothetical protein
MTYQKPEIAVLGDATQVVRGGKSGIPLESNQLQRKVADAELDD